MTLRTLHHAHSGVAGAIVLLAGCQSDVLSFGGHADQSLSVVEACAASGPGAGAIGTPCGPLAEESDPTFDGTNADEVSLQACSSSASGSAVCMAFHFQGRVTCPYGQNAQGRPPAGAQACETPSGKSVSGAVKPQCADRLAADTVFWSCRCANAGGRTDDGERYCTCPSGTACTQAVSALSTTAGADPLAGSYCIPSGADYSAGQSCSLLCDPTAHACP
jgi:hypothetical protein